MSNKFFNAAKMKLNPGGFYSLWFLNLLKERITKKINLLYWTTQNISQSMGTDTAQN